MITVSGTPVDGAEFRETSLEVAFQNRTIDFDPVIPSKAIACAIQCSDDPNCLAYDFDQISKCILMTQVDKLKHGTAQKMFIKGEKTSNHK